MVTLSADITSTMQKWVDEKAKSGLYKSKSEIVRELFRNVMETEKYPEAMASQRVLEKIWKDEPDRLWESYL